MPPTRSSVRAPHGLRGHRTSALGARVTAPPAMFDAIRIATGPSTLSFVGVDRAVGLAPRTAFMALTVAVPAVPAMLRRDHGCRPSLLPDSEANADYRSYRIVRSSTGASTNQSPIFPAPARSRGTYARLYSRTFVTRLRGEFCTRRPVQGSHERQRGRRRVHS